jgi:hypothetical protein
MGRPNQLSRYGAISKVLPLMNPVGKVFFVADINDAWMADLQEQYPPDSDGVVRVYQSFTTALASCVVGRGDVIMIAPGLTTTITGAAGVAVSVAGVTIIGLGNGQDRPIFNFTTAVGASFDITAANVTIKNCVFTCGIDNQTAIVNVSAADVAFEDCEFTTNTATIGAALGILTAATATRFRVERCRFLGTAANTGTTTTAQIDHEVGVDYVIKDSYFTGKCTQNITNGAAILRGLIDNCRFVTATGTKSINMHASSTPFITNCRFNVPSGTAPIVAAAGFVAGNVYSAAAGVTAGTASTF